MNVSTKQKVEFNIEMVDIVEMANEQGIEIDAYYLVFGVDQYMYGIPSLHVALLHDNDGDLMWMTERGSHITGVIQISRYPLPTVHHNQLVVQDHEL